MKQSVFIIKIISLLLVFGCIFYYQSVAGEREKAVAENAEAVSEVEQYNREIRAKMEADRMRAEGETAAAEEGPYKNGSYEGESMGYGGLVRVKVTVEEGYLQSVDVVEHSGEDPAYYMLAEQVVDRILDAQDTDVDTVSGATLSSAGILQAVDGALKKAVK